MKDIDQVIRDAVRSIVREELPRIIADLAGTTVDELLDTTAAGAIAKVKPSTIRGWIASGRLPAVRAGRTFRIRRGDIIGSLARVVQRGPVAMDVQSIDELATEAVDALMARRAS